MSQHAQKVLIAGATGYLGKHLINAFHRAGYQVRALARHRDTLVGQMDAVDQLIIAQATQPETLRGVMADVDIVVSALGITRQRDGLTYEDVDYQANVNLLNEAMQAGVKRFAYIHVKQAEALPHVAMAVAKSRFASTLEAADIASTIICPSGFFSDLSQVMDMARKGTVYLFGNGEARMSPIDGRDLATAAIGAIEDGALRIDIGGPQTLTQNDIARSAFAALGREIRIRHIPVPPIKALLNLAKRFGLGQRLGALEFFVSVSQLDMSAPPYGHRTLGDFFKDLAKDEAVGPARLLTV